MAGPFAKGTVGIGSYFFLSLSFFAAVSVESDTLFAQVKPPRKPLPRPVQSVIQVQKQELDWRACVQMLLERHPQIKAAEAGIARARLDKEKYAKALYIPQVSASIGAQESAIKTPASSVTKNTNYSAGIQANENLFAGFSDRHRYQQSAWALRAQELQLQVVKISLSAQLSTTFAKLADSFEKMTRTANVYERRKKNLELVKLRFVGGRENKGAVLLSEAYLTQAEHDRLQAELDSTNAKSTLASLIGIEDARDLKIKLDFSAPSVPLRLPLINQILSEQPEYLALQTQETIAEKDLNIATSAFYPRLDLAANYNQQEDKFFPDNKQQWSVGLNLTVPILDRGTDYYGRQEARVKVTQTQAQSSDFAKNLQVEVEKAFQDYQLALSQMNVQEKFLAAAEVRADIARKRYSNGLIGFDDWDLIENDLIARDQQLAQSKLNKMLAAINWQKTIGKGVLP